jgi:hypothetical protein
MEMVLQMRMTPMSKPSEKAMQLVEDIKPYFYIDEDDGMGNERRLWVAAHECTIALLCDKFAAEALTEHQRVIEMAEKALQFYSVAFEHPKDFALNLIHKDYGQQAVNALAEIAKIRKE